MKKKGFTMLELLAVIVLLGVVLMIIIPVTKNTIEKSKESLLEKQINKLLLAADKYAIDNLNPLYDDYAKVTIDELISSGYIENKETIDPVTEKKMTGCLVANYNNNQYEFSYKNQKCSELP